MKACRTGEVAHIDAFGTAWTEDDVLELAWDNWRLARALVEHCLQESPATKLEEWLREGEVVRLGRATYAFAGDGQEELDLLLDWVASEFEGVLSDAEDRLTEAWHGFPAGTERAAVLREIAEFHS